MSIGQAHTISQCRVSRQQPTMTTHWLTFNGWIIEGSKATGDALHDEGWWWIMRRKVTLQSISLASSHGFFLCWLLLWWWCTVRRQACVNGKCMREVLAEEDLGRWWCDDDDDYDDMMMSTLMMTIEKEREEDLRLLRHAQLCCYQSVMDHSKRSHNAKRNKTSLRQGAQPSGDLALISLPETSERAFSFRFQFGLCIIIYQTVHVYVCMCVLIQCLVMP